MPMSGTPSWAITEPSMYSTIECTTDCGCTMTCTWSGATSNSQRASMISRPLFISVAESIVILAPIFHVGCLSASSTVMDANFSAGHSRKGPPEAVKRMRWTSPRLWPTRHWKTALCSESTGSSGTPRRLAAAVMRLPAITSVSLLASAIVRPASMAAIVGKRPAPPTSAETTTSASTSRATATIPSGPASNSGRGAGSRRASWSRAPASSSATALGLYLRQMSATRSTLEPRAARPATTNSSEKLETISSVRSPMDPVAPRIVTRFMRTPSGERRNRTRAG